MSQSIIFWYIMQLLCAPHSHAWWIESARVESFTSTCCMHLLPSSSSLREFDEHSFSVNSPISSLNLFVFFFRIRRVFPRTMPVDGEIPTWRGASSSPSYLNNWLIIHNLFLTWWTETTLIPLQAANIWPDRVLCFCVFPYCRQFRTICPDFPNDFERPEGSDTVRGKSSAGAAAGGAVERELPLGWGKCDARSVAERWAATGGAFFGRSGARWRSCSETPAARGGDVSLSRKFR